LLVNAYGDRLEHISVFAFELMVLIIFFDVW